MHGAAYRLRVAGIGGDGDGLAAGRDYLADQHVGLVRRGVVGDGDAGPVGSQALGYGGADAARAAGDQGGLAVEGESGVVHDANLVWVVGVLMKRLGLSMQ
ncbi:hypothetical protein D9M68_850980 [compost metagenome]